MAKIKYHEIDFDEEAPETDIFSLKAHEAVREVIEEEETELKRKAFNKSK